MRFSVLKRALWFQDLCRAVNTIIVSPTDNRGLYNICSFNGTVREYGDAVGAGGCFRWRGRLERL